MLRKLLSHAAIYGLAAQLPRVAGVLALPIITPYLTTTDYGVAGVVTAYVTALSIVQSLGLSVVMVNAYVKHPTKYKWVWRQVHGFFILWSVVYNAALSLMLYFGIPEEATVYRWEIILLQVVPAFLFNHTVFFGVFSYQMQQRPLPVAAQSLLVGALTLGLNIYFIAYLHLGYMGWFYSGFVGALASFLMFLYPVYWLEQLWPIFKFRTYRIKSSLLVSVPTIPYQFSTFLLDASDKLVMDVLRVPLQRIGFYNIASSFGLYFSAASHAVVQAATPIYMDLLAKPNSGSAQAELRRATFSLQGLFLLVTSLVSLWMKEIFLFLIKNESLQGAYSLAIIILMGYNYRPMHLAVISVLTYYEKTKELWKISIIAGAGNVLLNLIFVPLLGIEAAAYTTFVALMYMGYSGFFLKEYRSSQTLQYYPMVWLCLTTLALIGMYFAVDLSLYLKLILTAIVVVGGAVSMLIFGKVALRGATR
ncbi:lipopolysaccharide biosynthesis protein [uncultured Pontibacter sp.]|uniref:lipopolysaccharide biosynthesis protein n=1 Tax=uncultured Pontibacter sp. TaxID=453356 RepID=UPI0026152827|nr:lipopolysaccharide biosynthesis protein [uncultured Pontibacter sp.]